MEKGRPEALRSLLRGNDAPVDLAQAAFGPGMVVFSRYSKGLGPDGKPMSVHTVLGLINQALDEVLAEQDIEYDSETRWAVAWFEQFGMAEGAFSTDDTYRFLDSVGRLLQAVSAEEAREVERQKQELLRLRFEEQNRRETRRAATTAIQDQPAGAPKRRRQVVTPIPTWPRADTSRPSSPPTWLRSTATRALPSTATPGSSITAPS